MSAESSPAPRRLNRLAGESSPYLLQHAHNPVDWYPWGQEAFERARREEKPIFLSVGYSTCYWCHVMERQSFEDEAVATVMNELFVNLKVDREERPDVDQLYMTGVQVQTHHGGWPMSVFLTPDREYFYGGTYFPPTDGYGRPGFVTLLRAIDDAWRNRRDEVQASAAHFTQILRRLAVAPPPRGPVRLDAPRLARLLDRCMSDYDPAHGGFGGAPKFPRQTLLELLLRAANSPALESEIAPRDSQIRQRLHHALDAMASGGIRDQLGGAFHRYSTDARWLVPHFEIMLYDNAMLGQIYAEASRALDEPAFGEVARGVFDAILRDFASPDGCFYTALDAEVDAREGDPYLWTAAEVKDALGATDAALFNRVYGLDQGPNFADPHAVEKSGPYANVLYVADRPAAVEHARTLTTLRQRLLEIRRRRKQPMLDTKIITAWNGLMIRALCVGGAALPDLRYVAAAARAAGWLLEHHRTRDGGLVRTSRNGRIGCNGFLDDYAFLAEAMLDLHDVTGETRWRQAAEDIAAQMMRRFHDDIGGGFYFSDASATDLIVRQKIIGDSPLPSGYAVAASVLRRLGDEATARRAVAAFAGAMVDHGESASRLLQTTIELLATGPIEVEVGWTSDDQAPADEIVRVEAVERASDDQLRIRLRIAGGWHIQANPAAEGLIPTRLIIPPEWSAAGATVGYPPGHPLEAPSADRPVNVYDGVIELIVLLPGDVNADGAALAVEFQACDDRSCRAPALVRFSLGANRENG